jgi:hypothetical protein
VRFCAPILEDTECEWADADNDVGVFAAGKQPLALRMGHVE